MGQRTQVILKLKDISGNVVNKVYHMQWGYGAYMPRQFTLLMQNLYEGEFEHLNSSYRKPDTKKRAELETMNKVDRLQLQEEINHYSIHNLKIKESEDKSIFDVSDEYENDMVNTETGETYHSNGEVFGSEIAPENAVKLLNWDFDLNNPHHIRAFEGDNNNGYMAIEVEEFVTQNSFGNDRFDTNISISFATGTEDEPDEVENSDTWNRVLTCEQYLRIFRNENNSETYDLVQKLFNVICEMYDVKQYGKELVTT